VKPVSLLDISVLLALSTIHHQFHASARRWWERERKFGWASCPISQNGMLRILSQPTFPGFVGLRTAAAVLGKLILDEHHTSILDDISIADPEIFDLHKLQGPGQLTDAYLLALASKNGGRLVTFDRRMSIAPVKTAKPENLVIPGK
jgi:uncharacterized protein